MKIHFLPLSEQWLIYPRVKQKKHRKIFDTYPTFCDCVLALSFFLLQYFPKLLFFLKVTINIDLFFIRLFQIEHNDLQPSLHRFQHKHKYELASPFLAIPLLLFQHSYDLQFGHIPIASKLNHPTNNHKSN